MANDLKLFENFGFENDPVDNKDEKETSLNFDAPVASYGQKMVICEKSEEIISDQITSKNDFILTKYLILFRSKIYDLLIVKYKRSFSQIIIGLFIILYNAYLIAAICFNIRNKPTFECCEGVGFLVILTLIVYWSLFYYWVLKKLFKVKKTQIQEISNKISIILNTWVAKLTIGGLILAGLICFLVLDMIQQPRRVISALGILILITIGFLISKHPGHIKWKSILWGLAIQFLFGLLVLRWSPGRSVLQCVSEKVKIFVEFTYEGAYFIYGWLITGTPVEGTNFPAIVACKSLSTLFFFGFVIQLLYHLGALQWVVVTLGWLLQISIGTTAVESMSVAANIFLGLADVPLLIKPFFNDLTKSEIHAIMTGGFGTIAGSMMAVYIEFGVSASHLLSASVMAAPGALAMSKLIYPETEKSLTTSDQVKNIETKKVKKDQTILGVATDGALQSLSLVGSIISICIAFIAFVSFINSVIGWFGGLLGLEFINLEYILGKIFIPFAWIMGVDSEEIDAVAKLIGVKLILTDFVAYQRLTKMALSPRSVAIATYALCSFANAPAIGVQLGILVTIAPNRKNDIVSVLMLSFVAAVGTNFLTACMAGCLLSEMGYDEWIILQNGINSTSLLL